MQTDPIDLTILELKGRVERVEQVQNGMVKEHYALDAEIKGIIKDLHYVKTGQDKLMSGVNKLVWTIALSGVAAFMTFVLKGGLAI